MKISGYQLFWLIFLMDVSMTALITVAPTIAIAKQDAWLSMIMALFLGVIITFIAVKLSLLYPKQTLIEYAQTILGKWLGRIIVIPYFLMWLSVTGIILREYADFVHVALFNATPLWIIVFMMVIAMVYVVYSGGLDGIARCSEIIGPLSVLGILFIVIMSYQNWDWHRILPIYANTGLYKIAKGSLPSASFLGESIMLLMLVPFISKPKGALQVSLLGVALASLSIVINTLIIIMVFGPNIAARFIYPVFSEVTNISVMNFLQNLDVLAVVLWISNIFIKLSLYLFITSYGSAQYFHIKKWKQTIWFIAPIVFIIALVPRNMDISQVEYPKFWLKVIFPYLMLAIPAFLWIIASLRPSTRKAA
jgi:spore germination protein KB